jgi:hypothetical protein
VSGAPRTLGFTRDGPTPHRGRSATSEIIDSSISTRRALGEIRPHVLAAATVAQLVASQRTGLVLADESPPTTTPGPGTPTVTTTPTDPSPSGTPNGTPASETATLHLNGPAANRAVVAAVHARVSRKPLLGVALFIATRTYRFAELVLW